MTYVRKLFVWALIVTICLLIWIVLVVVIWEIIT